MRDINFRSIGTHIIFWVVYFLYVWLPDSSISEKYWETFISACCLTPIVMAGTYYTIAVTVERFLLQKKSA